MKIFLKTLDGAVISFEVEPTDPIEQLKTQIEEKVGIPYDAQTLLSNGRQLDFRCTFNHYNITNESIIHITHRFRNCDAYHLLGTYNNRN
jgi:large subunit ribosomal protein L40e